MKMVDANVLLYAVNEQVPEHRPARTWLDSALAGREPVGLAWVVLLAFLRLSTQPRIFPRPLTVLEATDVVRSWLDRPAATPVHPTARHVDLLSGLLLGTGAGGNLVNDAHLAALAVEHGAEIVSFDAAFARFPGVRWLRPDD